MIQSSDMHQGMERGPVNDPQRTRIDSTQMPEITKEAERLDALKETEGLVREVIQDYSTGLENAKDTSLRLLQDRIDDLRLDLGEIANRNVEQAMTFLRKLHGELEQEAERLFKKRMDMITKRFGIKGYQGQDPEIEELTTTREKLLRKIKKINGLIAIFGGKETN